MLEVSLLLFSPAWNGLCYAGGQHKELCILYAFCPKIRTPIFGKGAELLLVMAAHLH